MNKELNDTYNKRDNFEIDSPDYETLNGKAIQLEDKKTKLIVEAASDMAVIHVYYKELGVIQYQRDELYSFVDFIGV